jgi:hypothetical protein
MMNFSHFSRHNFSVTGNLLQKSTAGTSSRQRYALKRNLTSTRLRCFESARVLNSTR